MASEQSSYVPLEMTNPNTPEGILRDAIRKINDLGFSVGFDNRYRDFRDGVNVNRAETDNAHFYPCIKNGIKP